VGTDGGSVSNIASCLLHMESLTEQKKKDFSGLLLGLLLRNKSLLNIEKLLRVTRASYRHTAASSLNHTDMKHVRAEDTFQPKNSHKRKRKSWVRITNTSLGSWPEAVMSFGLLWEWKTSHISPIPWTEFEPANSGSHDASGGTFNLLQPQWSTSKRL